MKAFDLQVTGSLVVTGSIKTTDGTFILSGSDSPIQVPLALYLHVYLLMLMKQI